MTNKKNTIKNLERENLQLRTNIEDLNDRINRFLDRFNNFDTIHDRISNMRCPKCKSHLETKMSDRIQDKGMLKDYCFKCNFYYDSSEYCSVLKNALHHLFKTDKELAMVNKECNNPHNIEGCKILKREEEEDDGDD